LASYLGLEKTEPTLFIFDEPTTGLHFHDIKRLLAAFDALIKRGHSIVIIEHNIDVIKCADYVIDLGPEGGNEGGRLVVAGTPEEVAACTGSYTGKFLKEKLER
jgi:excinuclease ABC subunit A